MARVAASGDYGECCEHMNVIYVLCDMCMSEYTNVLKMECCDAGPNGLAVHICNEYTRRLRLTFGLEALIECLGLDFLDTRYSDTVRTDIDILSMLWSLHGLLNSRGS